MKLDENVTINGATLEKKTCYCEVSQNRLWYNKKKKNCLFKTDRKPIKGKYHLSVVLNITYCKILNISSRLIDIKHILGGCIRRAYFRWGFYLEDILCYLSTKFSKHHPSYQCFEHFVRDIFCVRHTLHDTYFVWDIPYVRHTFCGTQFVWDIFWMRDIFCETYFVCQEAKKWKVDHKNTSKPWSMM